MARSTLPPDYGIDGPPVVAAHLMTSVVCVALAGGMLASGWSGVGMIALPLLIALYTGVMGLLVIVWSKVIKIRERDVLLRRIPWRGDEQVLDVGCGRGLMLIGAMQQAPCGRGLGIDVWRTLDQSGNRPEATLENARRAGVADRVRVETADMCQLPCEDASFDVVLTCWAVHNVGRRRDREQAMREMVRVLKPGGWLVVADVRHQREYALVLEDCGLLDLERPQTSPLALLAMVLSAGLFSPSALITQKPLPLPATLGPYSRA